MAGFEVIVRPVVFPNIRPAPTRSLPPEDDPEKGIAEIKGASGGPVDLPYSWSTSTSKSRPTETERRVDEATIYQKEGDGTVNKKNFVKVKVANRIKLWYPSEAEFKERHPNIHVGPRVESNFYKRIEETDNIEITNRDIIEKNPDASGAGT